MSFHDSIASLAEPKATTDNGHVETMSSDSSDAVSVRVPKCRKYLTFCIYASFMALGMSCSVGGPTFLHLTHIFDTDIQTLAVSFTTGSVGYLSGSAVCGIMADHFNGEIQFMLTTFLIGVAVVIAPWAPNIYVYLVIDFLKQLSMGYMDAFGQSYIICLWTGHRLKEPIMQALHGIWSVGATIGPFIIMPLIPELPEDDTDTDDAGSSSIIHNDHYNSTTSDPLPDNTTHHSTSAEFEGVAEIRLCYAIIGALVLSMSIFFTIGYCALGPTCFSTRKSKPKSAADKIERPSSPKTFVVVLLTLLFIFYAFYAWLEIIPGGYIATLVLKGLHWDVKRGPIITSLFWGSHGAGRLAAVPISFFLSPAVMTGVDLLGTSAGFMLMLVSLQFAENLLWFGAALAGFSMGSIFASMVLWTSEHMTITGRVGAVFILGSSAGSMVGGALTGYLFQNYSHMWMIYLSLIACAVEGLMFVSLLLFVKIYPREKPKLSEASETVRMT